MRGEQEILACQSIKNTFILGENGRYQQCRRINYQHSKCKEVSFIIEQFFHSLCSGVQWKQLLQEIERVFHWADKSFRECERDCLRMESYYSANNRRDGGKLWEEQPRTARASKWVSLGRVRSQRGRNNWAYLLGNRVQLCKVQSRQIVRMGLELASEHHQSLNFHHPNSNWDPANREMLEHMDSLCYYLYWNRSMIC